MGGISITPNVFEDFVKKPFGINFKYLNIITKKYLNIQYENRYLGS